jgi:hypothetical protein
VRLLLNHGESQVHALARAIAAVATPFVAIGDADTFYPPIIWPKPMQPGGQCSKSLRFFAHNSASAPITNGWSDGLRDLNADRRWCGSYAGWLCLCYRTAALRAASGYDQRAGLCAEGP